MSTNSEKKIADVNSDHFLKEFTFSKTDFPNEHGKIEFADNLVWIDDIVFIYQIKEQKGGTESDVDKWYNNKVIRKAKNQIKKTIEYLNKYSPIEIENILNEKLDVSSIKEENLKKIIIYDCDNLSKSNRSLKFYNSKDVGLIHLFHISDYEYLARFLHTPYEINEYFTFREAFYVFHNDKTNDIIEGYILSHFLVTTDPEVIDFSYLSALDLIIDEKDKFDIGNILSDFKKRIRKDVDQSRIDYKKIIKEIAKLNRSDLSEFKERFIKADEASKANELFLPHRFTVVRTGCGFVFFTLPSDKQEKWVDALRHFTLSYKYKNKLNKCLGVVILRNKSEMADINWLFAEAPWKFSEEEEGFIKEEKEFFPKGEVKKQARYKFKK
jgi:hypothetical protein